MNSQGRTFDDYLVWARDLAALKPLEPALYEVEECVEFLGNWVGACGEAPRLLQALGPTAEQFVLVAQFSLPDAVWREDLPIGLGERAVTGSLSMLSALCEQSGPTVVTHSFWMVVLRRWEVILGRDAHHRLLPTVQTTVLEQLRTARGGPCLRDSAWEGIKMIDEQVAAEARAIEREFEGSPEGPPPQA